MSTIPELPPSTGNSVRVWRCAASQCFSEPYWLPKPAYSLDQATAWLPGGAYTTLRTYGRTGVLHLEEHFQRLEESARLAGYQIALDRHSLRQALRQAVQAYGSPGETRLRLVLDLEQEPGTLYLALEALVTPALEAYQNGVVVVTSNLQRENPKAKLTAFIAPAAQVRQTLPPGVNEALLVDVEGYLLEGTSSNFFAVRDGVLYTAEAGVLDGITRQMVLALAARLALPVRRQAVHLRDLPCLQEAFITSASRAILPVVKIDDKPVGAGQVGLMTRRLMQAYATALEAEIEAL